MHRGQIAKAVPPPPPLGDCQRPHPGSALVGAGAGSLVEHTVKRRVNMRTQEKKQCAAIPGACQCVTDAAVLEGSRRYREGEREGHNLFVLRAVGALVVVTPSTHPSRLGFEEAQGERTTLR